MVKAEVKKTISGCEIDFIEEKLRVSVERLDAHSDGRITGILRMYIGKNKQTEPPFSFNFSSAQTRKQLTNNLNEKYPEWQWLEIIDFIINTVQRLITQGEPSTIIKPTTTEIKHPGYFVEPVIMKSVPNVIYGDKGSKKTTLSLCLLGLIALGIDDSQLELAGQKGNVALLDWENNAALTDYTLSRLVKGGTLPYFELPYLRCVQPLADDMDRIGKFLQENKVDLVMIDSLGKAAGSDRFDSAGKNSALKYFQALSEFNITSLSIGQNAKNEEGKKSIYGSTYYTYYSRNIFSARNSKENLGGDEETCALIHEESNFSKKYPPIGFRLTYTDTTISIVHSEANLSQYYDRVSQAKALLEYLKHGAKSTRDIAQELEVTDNRARVLLSQLKKRGKVLNLGAGEWGLTSDVNEVNF